MRGKPKRYQEQKNHHRDHLQHLQNVQEFYLFKKVTVGQHEDLRGQRIVRRRHLPVLLVVDLHQQLLFVQEVHLLRQIIVVVLGMQREQRIVHRYVLHQHDLL